MRLRQIYDKLYKLFIETQVKLVIYEKKYPIETQGAMILDSNLKFYSDKYADLNSKVQCLIKRNQDLINHLEHVSKQLYELRLDYNNLEKDYNLTKAMFLLNRNI